MKPSITTIIPAYNSEAFIERCLDSLLCQDFTDFRIIVVDDGSTDKTLEIVQRYIEGDSRISVIHTENKGVSSARNTGLDAADSEYVNFVDSDDTAEPGYYSSLLSAMREEEGTKIAQCSFNYIQANGDINVDKHQYVGVIAGEDRILQAHYEGMIGIITMALWDKLFLKETIGDIRFDTSLTMYEDVDFMYKVLKKTDKVNVIGEALYNYYQNAGSAMHKGRDNLQCFTVYERILKDLDDDLARKNLAMREVKQALWFMRGADKDTYNRLRKYAIQNRALALSAPAANLRLRVKMLLLRNAPGFYYKAVSKKNR